MMRPLTGAGTSLTWDRQPGEPVAKSTRTRKDQPGGKPSMSTWRIAASGR